MLIKQLLFCTLLAVVAVPVLAQTGRIAHFSHGGSLATLAQEGAAADNFGTPTAYFEVDSVRYLSEDAVMGYGRWRWTGRKETTYTLRLPKKMSAALAARYVRKNDLEWHWSSSAVAKRGMKLLGFDSTRLARPEGLPGQPAGEGQRRRRKASLSVLLVQPPAGSGLAALLLLGLAGAGWRLAGQPRPLTAA